MIKFRNLTVTKPKPTCADRVVFAMADTMREIAFAGQNVSAETLALHGFTHDVVEKFGERAVAHARRLSVRQVASHA